MKVVDQVSRETALMQSNSMPWLLYAAGSTCFVTAAAVGAGIVQALVVAGGALVLGALIVGFVKTL